MRNFNGDVIKIAWFLIFCLHFYTHEDILLTFLKILSIFIAKKNY